MSCQAAAARASASAVRQPSSWAPAPCRSRRRRRSAQAPVYASLLDLLRGGSDSGGPSLEADTLGEELKVWAAERGLQAPQVSRGGGLLVLTVCFA